MNTGPLQRAMSNSANFRAHPDVNGREATVLLNRHDATRARLTALAMKDDEKLRRRDRA